VIDFRMEDSNLSPNHRRSIQSQIKIGCQAADLVTCNSLAAYPYLNEWSGGHCSIVRNGVEIERFGNIIKTGERRDVGFVGSISNWIDFALIEKLLQRFPDVQFNFHGIVQAAEEHIRSLDRYKNFHWYGKLHPADVPSFMASCKIGIVPYDPQRTWNTTGDAMKMFEYLAAGTPVISTAFQPNLLDRFDHLALVYGTHEEFVDELGNQLLKDIDPTWQEKAWEFVKKNTWLNRVDEILKISGNIQTH
jgi:glycosyltransferase involved in cell wall biosynthesis